MSTNELVYELKQLLKIHDDKSIIYIPNIQNALNIVFDLLQSHSQSTFQLKYGIQSSITNESHLLNKINYDIDKDGGINIDLILPSDINGIVISNFLGHVVDIEKYEFWTTHYFKYLIIDNRLTPYTFYNNKNVCNYGNVSIISFPFHSDGFIIIDKTIVFNDDITIYPYTDTILYESILNNNNDKEHQYFWEQVELYNIPIYQYPCYSDFNNNKFVTYIVFFTNILFTNINEILFNSYRENNIQVEKYYKPMSTNPNVIDTLFYDNIICLPCFGINQMTIQLYIDILRNHF